MLVAGSNPGHVGSGQSCISELEVTDAREQGQPPNAN